MTDLDERLKEKQDAFRTAAKDVQRARDAIWMANIHDLEASRTAALAEFRADYPLTDSERASVGRLLDAFESKWDRSYENLVAVLR